MAVSRIDFTRVDETPVEPTFDQEVSGKAKDAILRSLGDYFPQARHPNADLRALCQPDGIAGRYSLTTPGGRWFVRVSSRDGFPELEQSISSYLFQRGVNVNPLTVSGVSLDWKKRSYRVDLRPYVNGRHFDGSYADLGSAARVLAGCHRAFTTFPRAGEIQANASERSKRLASVVGQIKHSLNHSDFSFFEECSDWARQNRDWLEELVTKFEPRLDLRPGSQCVHGELNLSNVLFQKAGGGAMMIDFEASPALFVPVSWDIAYVFQCFCLRDNPHHEETHHRLSVVADSYGSPLPELAPMMAQIAWFTVVSTLEARIASGVVTLPEEYDKLVMIQRQARKYEGVC